MTELSVSQRDQIGKKVKKVRDEGFVPGVVYGQKTKTLNISVPEKEFNKVYSSAGESSVIDLKIEGQEKTLPVLIYHTQRDPLSGQFLHVDFYKVDMKKEITAEVPLEFVGQSMAVKNEGGVLITSLKSVEVKSLPADMPQKIVVDIGSLATFDDVIYIKDLSVAENVEVIADPETAVALVKAPKSEKEIAAEEEAEQEADVAGETGEAQGDKEEKQEDASQDGQAQDGKTEKTEE